MPAALLPLGPGGHGEPVRDLQRRLGRAGFDHAGDDPGRFGPSTTDAVRRFQAARGLAVDGVCGSQTWNALVEAGYRLGDRLLYHRTPMLRGDDVADLQGRLGNLGFFADRIDGIFGPLTAAATTDFQRNAGLTSDAICGPETVAALHRVGGRPHQAVKGGLMDRERLRSGPRLLVARRIVIGDAGGLGALAATVARTLQEGGAVVDVCAHPDQSAQATAANDFAADVYLGLRLQTDSSCHCAYYGRSDYESAGGRQLAARLAHDLPVPLGVGPSVATAMQVPVLRETRMVAVLCAFGPPSIVVQRTAELAHALTTSLISWAAAPIEGSGPPETESPA